MHPSSSGNTTFGEPEEWSFDYSWEVIQTGFWLWAMSDFKHLPTQDEILRYDKRYLSDIRLAYTIYSHQGNNSPIMQIFEQLTANEQAMKSRQIVPEDGI